MCKGGNFPFGLHRDVDNLRNDDDYACSPDALRSTRAVSEHDVSVPGSSLPDHDRKTKVPGESELMCRTEAKRGANVTQGGGEERKLRSKLISPGNEKQLCAL
jgi:hypothetical protein